MSVIQNNLRVEIGPHEFRGGGTWTYTGATQSAAPRKAKTAAAATSVVSADLCPVKPHLKGMGLKLKALTLCYLIETADLTTFTPTLVKYSASSDSFISVPFSYDAGHDTNGERVGQGDHVMVLTPDGELWLEQGDLLWLSLSIVDPGTSEFTLTAGSHAIYEAKF